MRTLLGEVLSAVAKAVEPFRERIADTLIDFCDDLEDIVDEWNKHSDKDYFKEHNDTAEE